MRPRSKLAGTLRPLSLGPRGHPWTIRVQNNVGRGQQDKFF